MISDLTHRLSRGESIAPLDAYDGTPHMVLDDLIAQGFPVVGVGGVGGFSYAIFDPSTTQEQRRSLRAAIKARVELCLFAEYVKPQTPSERIADLEARLLALEARL